MKTTGIVRKIDELGRIVLPMEIRKVLEIKVGDSLEISNIDDTIVIKKYSKSCIFCGREEGVKEIKGKAICNICANEIRQL